VKILVTGSDGFIGKSLCYYIESKMDITPYTLETADFYNDIDWALKLTTELYEINPDVIFHVGACSDTLEKRVNYMMELNYESTKIISDWSRANERKMIYSSSAASYGVNNKFPSNLYGWSKYVAEGYVISNGGVALRYFNVYGPGESHKGKMSSVALQMYNRSKDGESIYLFPGNPERDFVYIKDVISANFYSMENYDLIKSDWYDVGSFESRTFEDVLLNIGIMNWEYTSEDWIPEGYQYFTKATKIIPGWKPKYTIENGLKEYMNFLNHG
jgi:ADP-L-glycero-D-manno-heptose 6-epimerase